MKVIQRIEDIDKNQWVELLHASSTTSIFQSPDFYNFILSQPHFMPFVCAIETEGRLKGVCEGFVQCDGGTIKRYFSRRAIINGGPLLAKDATNHEVSLLMQSVKEVLRGKAIYIEIRCYHDYSLYTETLQNVDFQFCSHLNFHIDTTNEQSTMANMGKSVKRDIKVSLRQGTEVKENPSVEEIIQLYDILNELYHEKIKTPLMTLDFFISLAKQDFCHILIVQHRQQVVGGAVYIGIKKQILYEWFICGKDREEKLVHPSMLATYSGVRYAATHGYYRFDMMGAGRPNESYGVRDFKAKFGGKLVSHGRYIHLLNPLLYYIGKTGISILKRI